MLRVADDGIGIRPEQLDKRAEGHLGLRLLIDRIADQGGELRIEARPDGGTAAVARMPVDWVSDPAPPVVPQPRAAGDEAGPTPPNSGGTPPSPAAAPHSTARTD